MQLMPRWPSSIARPKPTRPASDDDDLRGVFGGHVHFGFLRLAAWSRDEPALRKNENRFSFGQEKSHNMRFLSDFFAGSAEIGGPLADLGADLIDLRAVTRLPAMVTQTLAIG